MFRGTASSVARSVFVAKRFSSSLKVLSKGSKFPIYELRTYVLSPRDYPAFLKLTNEKIHMRTNHSPLLGYWTTELGGLNEVVHIWGYESLVQRQKIRNALAGDDQWNGEYMALMRPMLQSQENFIMVPKGEIIERFPESDETDLPAYELEFVGIDEPEKDSDDDEEEKSVNIRTRIDGKLVGTWTPVVGSLNGSTIRLWRYPALEAIDVAVKTDKGPFEFEQVNKILFPTPFSPLQ